MGIDMNATLLTDILARKNPTLFWNLLRNHPELAVVYKKVELFPFL